jgi:hypothetical protein
VTITPESELSSFNSSVLQLLPMRNTPWSVNMLKSSTSPLLFLDTVPPTPNRLTSLL